MDGFKSRLKTLFWLPINKTKQHTTLSVPINTSVMSSVYGIQEDNRRFYITLLYASHPETSLLLATASSPHLLAAETLPRYLLGHVLDTSNCTEFVLAHASFLSFSFSLSLSLSLSLFKFLFLSLARSLFLSPSPSLSSSVAILLREMRSSQIFHSSVRLHIVCTW